MAFDTHTPTGEGYFIALTVEQVDLTQVGITFDRVISGASLVSFDPRSVEAFNPYFLDRVKEFNTVFCLSTTKLDETSSRYRIEARLVKVDYDDGIWTLDIREVRDSISGKLLRTSVEGKRPNLVDITMPGSTTPEPVPASTYYDVSTGRVHTWDGKKWCALTA